MDAYKLPPVQPGLRQLAGTAPVIDSRVYTCLQLHEQFTRPLSRPVHVSAPIYNEEDNLLVHTGIQRCGRLIYIASDAAFVFTVRLSRPGLHQHTGPHLSARAVY